MSTEIPDVDPRKVFLAFLIGRLVEVEHGLYHIVPPQLHSIFMMQGIIDSLDEESQKQLHPKYEELEKYSHAQNQVKHDDLRRIYRDLSSYLHKTYLAEVRFGPTTRITGLTRLEEKLR